MEVCRPRSHNDGPVCDPSLPVRSAAETMAELTGRRRGGGAAVSGSWPTIERHYQHRAGRPVLASASAQSASDPSRAPTSDDDTTRHSRLGCPSAALVNCTANLNSCHSVRYGFQTTPDTFTAPASSSKTPLNALRRLMLARAHQYRELRLVVMLFQYRSL